jgi:hypothetical protein
MSPDAPDRKKQVKTTVGIETALLAWPVGDANGCGWRLRDFPTAALAIFSISPPAMLS